MNQQHLECAALWERAERILAGGPATLSKHATRYPLGIAPMMLSEGQRAYVTCADGRQYVDCVAALGPIILGHDHPAVTDAVCYQAQRLASSTLSTALEVEVAEMLTSIIPGAEMCRMATNGADVTNAAVKVARYITDNRYVLYCGYHGSFNDYLSTTDKDGGILDEVSFYNRQVPWRDFKALEDAMWDAEGDIAAIMLEVPPEAPDIAKDETAAIIRRYADAAHQAGALFILDEVVTGLRYGLGGAQAYYGVEADLITMSKALGNGYPIAAILGPRDLMRAFEGGTVFLSTTFGANPISLAACKATLHTLLTTDALTQLELYGLAALTHMVHELAYHDLPATVRGNYARFVIDWHGIDGIATADELRTLWLQELHKRGILAGVPWFSMCCWDYDVVTQINNAVTGTCGVLREVITGENGIAEALECPVITNVFERYQRQVS